MTDRQQLEAIRIALRGALDTDDPDERDRYFGALHDYTQIALNPAPRPATRHLRLIAGAIAAGLAALPRRASRHVATTAASGLLVAGATGGIVLAITAPSYAPPTAQPAPTTTAWPTPGPAQPTIGPTAPAAAPATAPTTTAAPITPVVAPATPPAPTTPPSVTPSPIVGVVATPTIPTPTVIATFTIPAGGGGGPLPTPPVHGRRGTPPGHAKTPPGHAKQHLDTLQPWLLLDLS